MAAKNYVDYVQLVHDGYWKKSNFGKFLCDKVQDFVERETTAPYEIMVLNVPPQHGKLISNETPVLTKNGWKKHGDLAVGDFVLNHKGSFTKLTHIHPKYEANMAVFFSNGEIIKCHENHEWLIYDKNKHREVVLETKYIENNLKHKKHGRGNSYRFHLPLKDVIHGEKKHLNVNPYVFGAWLGD